MAIQVVLQDQRGRHCVDSLLAFPPVTFVLREQFVGGVARETFVLKRNRYGHPIGEQLREFLDSRRLIGRFAAEPTRQSDHDHVEAVRFSDEPVGFERDPLRSCADVRVVRECLPRRRQQPRRVRQRKSDSPFTVVDAEHPHVRRVAR